MSRRDEKPLRLNILSVALSVLNPNTALGAILEALEKKSKGYICVTGVHGVMEAQSDAQFRAILNGAFLNTPDGIPMVWVGKLRGFKEMDRVYGPDLMLLVAKASVERGFTHFLYGGGDGIADQLKARLEQKFPGIRIVGTYTPPFRPLNSTEESELIARVNALRPDIIWVGLSTPKQEKFMAQYSSRLDATLMFGVGAAFDFHAGRIRQAPRWMQRSGLEWFFRLCCEPRRLWKRYFKNNPLFVWKILGQFLGWKKYSLD